MAGFLTGFGGNVNGVDVNVGSGGASIGSGDFQITIGGGGGTSGGNARDVAVSTVNAYEVYFKANRDDFLAGRKTLQEGADYFDKLWNSMVTALQPLGTEGTRAIADRQQGGKFDWFLAYRPQGSGVTAPATTSVVVTGSGAGQGVSTGVVTITPPVQTAGLNNIWVIAAFGLGAWLLLKR